MPSLLQYPLERERDVQRRWGRLLQRTAGSRRCGETDFPMAQAGFADLTPPRDRKDCDELDDEEENEDEEEHEPAVIREPDEDE